MFGQVMELIKQSLDCKLWLSHLLSTTRGGGIGTCLGCGNVVSPSNQPTVGIINKQVKQHSWQPLLFVQRHFMSAHSSLCADIGQFVRIDCTHKFKPCNYSMICLMSMHRSILLLLPPMHQLGVIT